MKKATILTVLFVLVAGFTLPEVQAQTFQVGPRIGYDLAGDPEDLFLGIEGRAAVAVLPITLSGVFDFFLTDNNPDSFFQFSINGLYSLGSEGNDGLAPYVGVGVGINRISDNDFSDTSTGLNLIGGAHFRVGTLRPYFQGQLTLGEADLLTIGVGLPFNVGNDAN